MSQYRVHVNVEVIVEINEENENIEGPPALQGNSPLIATRRALWHLFRQDINQIDREWFAQTKERRRPLGVRRTLMHQHERDIRVEIIEASEVDNA